MFVNNEPNFINNRPGLKSWKKPFNLVEKINETQKKQSHIWDTGSTVYRLVFVLSEKQTETTVTVKVELREKCLNTELFLAHIFLFSDWIRIRNDSVFGHF